MAAYQIPFSPTNQPMQVQPTVSSQSFFSTPQGNLYIVNNPLELGNIPMSTGISGVICFNSGTLYLKAMQNGAPAVVSYKLVPHEEEKKIDADRLSDIERRLASLEQVNSYNPNNSANKGGDLDGLI